MKTRFRSILLMLKRILEYRKAVTICYGQSSQVDLQVRNPSVTEWLVAQRVFECLKPIMDACILNQATESWLLSDTISSCVTLTAKLSKISQDAIPSDGTVEPGTFNYELGMYLRDAVASARDYIKQHLGFLQEFDVTNAHYVISLLLDPRHTRLTLLVDYARINGSADIPLIKRNVKAYLDVLIYWLQSFITACMVTVRLKILGTKKWPTRSISSTSRARMRRMWSQLYAKSFPFIKGTA